MFFKRVLCVYLNTKNKYHYNIKLILYYVFCCLALVSGNVEGPTKFSHMMSQDMSAQGNHSHKEVSRPGVMIHTEVEYSVVIIITVMTNGSINWDIDEQIADFIMLKIPIVITI